MSKVLFINEYSVLNNDAVGITIRNMFNNSNLEYFDLYKQPKKNKIKSTIKSFIIPSDWFPLDSILRNSIKRPGEKLASISNKTSFKNTIKNYIKFISQKTFKPKKNSDLFKEVIKFDPDHIYTTGDSISTLLTSLYFSEFLDIPIVMHYMDDWRGQRYTKNPLLRKQYLKILLEVEKRIQVGFVISEKMKISYKKKLPFPLFPIMNTVDSDNNNIIKTIENSSKINLLYTGGIHYNRWETLLELAKLIEEFNKSRLTDIKLNIYTHSPLEEIVKKFKDINTITFNSAVDNNLVNDLIKEADVIFHVESFDKNTMEFIEYSMSTKLPEYLISNRPILYYGPKEIAMYNYLHTHEAALCATNKKELYCSLDKLLMNDHLCKLENAKKLAEKNHSQEYRKKIFSIAFS